VPSNEFGITAMLFLNSGTREAKAID